MRGGLGGASAVSEDKSDARLDGGGRRLGSLLSMDYAEALLEVDNRTLEMALGKLPTQEDALSVSIRSLTDKFFRCFA